MTNSTVEFVRHLTSLNIELETDGVSKAAPEELRLRCHAPEGVLTPALSQEIAARKTEIILFLQQAKQVKTAHQLPIQRVSREGELPLSFAQQRLWFLHQLSPNTRAYNLLLTLQLEGTLNVVALTESLSELLRRHEILRTNFPAVDGKPVQVIAPPTEVTLPIYNLQGLSAQEQSDRIRQMVDSIASQPFDLAVGPLIQFTLLQLSDQKHILLLKMHHIIYDGWSLNIFNRELSQLYTAFTQGLPNPLPELTIQYADFAVWQRQWLTGEVLDRQLTYWQKQLADAPTVLELPTDKPRLPVQSFRGGVERFQLNHDLTQRLLQLSQESDATLFMTLLAAFLVLMSRYSGQLDIVVGSPIANRNHKSVREIMGFFANTLALRADLSGNPSFTDFLAQVRQTTLSAYAHQDLPFEMLVEKLQPERDLSRNPLVQVAFSLQNGSQPSWNLPSLTIENISLPIDETVRFDLEVNYWEVSGGLEGIWSYSADLFDATTIARIAQHFQTLLEGIITNPTARIAQIPLLSAAEQHQLLVEWNNTQTDYPQDKCIHQLFEAQVEKTPDAVAVVFGNQQLTYQQLNTQANQLAHYLQSLGVGADVLVGICVERSLEMVVGILGILKAGGAYVPLDPEYPQERLSFMLEDTGLSVILTTQILADNVLTHKARVVCFDTNAEAIAHFKEQNPTTQITPDNLAYVIYTSGSTGKPKGVAVNHRAVNRLVMNTNYIQIEPKDVIAQASNCAFDAATFEIWGALLNGARLVGVSKDLALSPQNFAAFLQAQTISVLFLTTALFNQIAQEVPSAFNSLRYLLFGGEAVDPKWVKQVIKNGAPQRLLHVYGPTENTTFSSWYLVENVPQGATTIPIGRPISNTQIYVLDSQLQPVPIGVPGELHIGGKGLARGYFNRPETTAEKFIEIELFNQVERLYKTGDKARYLPDGNIEYLGRIDNQVKIRGFRIELSEIEIILSQHSDVQVSCVIVREDTPGDKRLVAYVVAERDCQPTMGELRQFLKAKLPDYMVPNAIVILESLPLTHNGKVDRRALPAPDLYSERQDKFVAPRNPIEEILSAIWMQVLKVEQVGIHDNFFELGGHSLLATQLISRVRNSLKVELPLRSLFAAPTVAELSQHIKRSQQQNFELTASAISPRTSDADLPLSYAQQRLWFLDKLNPNSAFYNIPIALRLVGTLNQAALEKSLQAIIHRHEALRTNFITVDGKPIQVIRELLTENREQVIDLRHLPTSKKESVLQQLAQQQATQPFDLANEALIRATLVMLSETEQALLICIHHIVFDGWSLSLLFQELAALYNAYSQGQASPLLPLPIQYADFAIWQRRWLQENVLQSQLSYWQQQLKDAPALLNLPTDRPRPAVQTFSGAYQEFTLSVELTNSLVKLSQEQSCTLFMTLLAAYDTLLYRYTGQEDILVGSPIANRDRSEIEELIGFFVNTLVMRSNLAGNPSFLQLLSRVREVALGAYAHQNLPFEMLVEALQPERDLSYTPLFQVMFALQNASTSGVELTGLTATPLIAEGATAKFDLSLLMQNTATGLVGFWEYNTDLFDASTIERMTGHFVALLESIVTNPEQSISQLPLLTQTEQQQLLVEWNDTQADYPLDKCIHQLFEEQVQLTPDAIAVVYENQQLTYQELNSRANSLAHYLKSLGVGADVLVGICVERSLEMVVGLLGILKAGGAYLPLDPDYPTERLHFMLEDAQVKVLLTQQRLVDRLSQCEKAGGQGAGGRGKEGALSSPASYQAKLVCLDTDALVISQFSQDNFISEVDATNLAYVIYTSGSTGTPKGVMIAHQSLLNLVFWHQQAFNVTSSDKATQLAGTAFDAAVWELWPYLTAGASIHLVNSQLLSSLTQLQDWLIDNQITISFLPTPLAEELLSLEWATEGLALRAMLTGGDKLQQYPSDSIPFQVVNNYGPTENTVVTTSGVVAKGQDQISPNIGRAIANTQVYILDKNLQPVPVGVPGELHIGGVGLARGYLNRPELTEERFIPNPFRRSRGAGEQGSRGKIFSNSERLYKTGDLVRYLPDGNIEYLGRIDNQVKIRGFRIELAEIETLLGQHSDVQTCCVIAREGTPGNKQLVAYVVPQKDVTLTTAELRQFLTDKLPGYMLPTAFVILESFPLTPNGKVDRRALPNPDSHQELSDYVMPNTETETIIAEIWQTALQVEKVGIYDNFFELGGHSLLLVKINQQLQEKLGLEVSIIDMFNYPNIHSLSQYLNTKTQPKKPARQNISQTQYRSEIKALKSQQLQSRQQYRSQQKGRK